MKDKKSFVFHREWYEALKNLDDSVRLEVYDAIMCHVFGDGGINISSLASMAMCFITPKLQQDIDRYNSICESRKAFGRKGGVAKASKSQQKVAKGSKSWQVLASVADNDIQVSKDTMSIYESSLRSDSNQSSSLRSDDSSNSNADSTHKPSFKDEVVAYFNEKMSHAGISCIRSIDNKREEMLRARVKQYGKDAIFEMIDKASASSFLNGNNKKSFIATFDWLIRPNNFPKVLEGNYDDGREYNKRTEPEQLKLDWQS